MRKTPGEIFGERQKRVQDSIALKEADRVLSATSSLQKMRGSPGRRPYMITEDRLRSREE